jgi:ADP-ribose pyrophosphatase
VEDETSDSLAFSHGDWVQVYIDPDPTGHGPGYIRIEERQGAPGVAVLPIRGQDVGLISIFRRLLGATVLEMPRGFGGEGTGPRSDAVRELREETGISFAETDLIDLGDMPPNSGLLKSKVRLYIAMVTEGTQIGQVEDLREVANFAWYGLPDVYRRIADGSLTDPFASTALLRASTRGLIKPPGAVSTS